MGVAQAVQTFDGNNSFMNGINYVTMRQFAYHAKFGESTSTSTEMIKSHSALMTPLFH
jgi:hypothetical protein